MPVKVINAATGDEVTVSSEQAQEGLVSGAFLAPAGVNYKVTRDGTRHGMVDGDKLAGAIDRGWNIADNEQYRKTVIQDEESDIGSQAQGIAEGLVNGLSFGGYAAGAAVAGADMERYAARRSEGAEMAGAIAPTILSGGASLLGRGAAAAGAAAAERSLLSRGVGALGRAAAAPTKALSGAGRAIEGAVAGRVGGTAGKILAPAIGGGFEGVMAGVGATMSEVAIGQRDLSAEEWMASVGMGGLFGVGAGAAIPTAGMVLAGTARTSKKAFSAIVGRSSGVSSASDAAASGLAAEARAPWWNRWYSKSSSALTGAPEDMISKNLTNATRNSRKYSEIVGDMPGYEKRQARMVMEDIIPIRGQAAVVDEVASKTASARRRTSAGLPEGAHHKAHEATAARLGSAHDEIGKAQLINDQLAMTGSQPHYVSRTLDTARRMLNRVEAERMLSGTPDAFASHASLTTLRNDLEAMIVTGKRAEMSHVARTNDLLDGIIKGVDRQLLDEGLYGTIAKGHRDFSAAMEASRIADAELSAEGGGLIAKLLSGDGAINHRAASQMIASYRRGSEIPGALEKALTAKERLISTVRKHSSLSAEEAGKLADAERHIKALRQKLTAAAEDADVYNVAKMTQSAQAAQEGAFSAANVAMTAGGYALGGMGLSAVSGAVTAAARRPATVAKALAAIKTTIDDFRGTVHGGTDTFVTSVAGAGAAEEARVGRDLLRSVAGPAGFAAGRERAKAAADTSKRIAELQDPERLEAALGDVNSILSAYAPNMAAGAYAVAQRAVEFLSANKPKFHKSSIPGMKPIADQNEIDRFARYSEAIMNPAATIARLSSGTLTPDHVSAMAAVYPKWLDGQRQRVLGAVATAEQAGRLIPYWKRIMIGHLLNLPLDPSLDPRVATLIASTHAPAAPDQPQAPASKIRQGNTQERAQALRTDLDSNRE